MKKFMKKNGPEVIRTAIQIVFLLILPSAFSSAFAAVKGVCEAFGEGAVLSLTPFAKILLFLLLFTVIFGRFFCGYACAFGAASDWIYKLSAFVQKKLGKKLPKIPNELQRILQILKYVVLAGIMLLCVFGQARTVNANSPWTLFSRILSREVPGEDFVIAGVLLGIIVILSIFTERAFCQFLCPMGAVFSLMPVLPTGQLTRDRAHCLKGCSLCERTCPVSLSLGEDSFRNGECIRCNRCAVHCPAKNISVRPSRFRSAEPVWTVLQAAVLFIVLKFVIGM